MFETIKKINSKINLWIRCPGCIMNVALCMSNIIMNYNVMSRVQLISGCIIIGSVYWNGIYFMNQVVTDYTKCCNYNINIYKN